MNLHILLKLIQDLKSSYAAAELLDRLASEYAAGNSIPEYLSNQSEVLKRLELPCDCKTESYFEPLQKCFVTSVSDAYYDGFQAAVMIIGNCADDLKRQLQMEKGRTTKNERNEKN